MSYPWQPRSARLTPSPYRAQSESSLLAPTSHSHGYGDASTIDSAVQNLVDILATSSISPSEAAEKVQEAMQSAETGHSGAVPNPDSQQPPSDLAVNAAIWGFNGNGATQNTSATNVTASRKFIPMAAVQQKTYLDHHHGLSNSSTMPASRVTTRETSHYATQVRSLGDLNHSSLQSHSFPDQQQSLHGNEQGTTMIEQPSIGSSRPHTWSGPRTDAEVFQLNGTFERMRSLTDAPPPYQHHPTQHDTRQNGNDTTAVFRPMQAVLEPAGRQSYVQRSNPTYGYKTISPYINSTFSSEYCGMRTPANASADWAPDHLNCSLWIRDLHPQITYSQLLASIRNLGRIWCTYINKPDGVRHTHAAAKVVFFNPRGAQRYLEYLRKEPRYIGNASRFNSPPDPPTKAGPNRIKTLENPVKGGASRVLIVTGDVVFVNEASLKSWFGNKFVFQIDEIKELAWSGRRAVVKFSFGSYRCQAQVGKIALDRERPDGFEKAEFGDDPCEVGEEEASKTAWTIACQRLHGIGLGRDGVQ